MSSKINIEGDFLIPSGFVSAIAQINEYQVNDLGTRWYSLDSPDLSQEVEDLLKQMRPAETFLLFQAISSLVLPVFIWDCYCAYFPLSNFQISAYIPDYDGIIPPLLIWKDGSEEQLHIKRVTDRETLIHIIDDIIISDGFSGVKEDTIYLPVDTFLYLLCLSDAFHLSWFQALENHSPFRNYINFNDINIKSKDPFIFLTIGGLFLQDSLHVP